MDCPARERGAGDHDEAYRFGRLPTERAPFPFTPRELARLLLFRAKHEDRAALRSRSGAESISPEEPHDVHSSEH